MKNSDTNSQRAEIISLQALGFIASETSRFSRFLQLSGLEAPDIAGLASKPEFLASVLDYLLSDENLLLDFSQDQSLDPADIKNLRRKLPGAIDI